MDRFSTASGGGPPSAARTTRTAISFSASPNSYWNAGLRARASESGLVFRPAPYVHLRHQRYEAPQPTSKRWRDLPRKIGRANGNASFIDGVVFREGENWFAPSALL